MLESMQYIGTQDTYIAFATPSMSHAELRAVLSLDALDAGFIGFREKQHIQVRTCNCEWLRTWEKAMDG